MKIGEMPAGRDLDALVAEKVMGYEVWKTLPHRGAHEEVWCAAPRDLVWTALPELASYSTDTASAWEVCQWADTFSVQRIYDPDGQVFGGDFYFQAHISKYDPEGFGTAAAPTAARAICLAALLAVGVETA